MTSTPACPSPSPLHSRRRTAHAPVAAGAIVATILTGLLGYAGSGCRGAEGEAAAASLGTKGSDGTNVANGARTGARDAPGAASDAPAVAVKLAAVERGPVARPIHGTGVVRLKSEADLSFKVGGVVAAVLVEEGARVKKGQVLARLDPTEVDASLRQAEEARAKADRDLERVRKLHASGALPIVELQNAETGASMAGAALAAASFNAQRSAVIAPEDGRVDKRVVEPGEIVAPGRPVFHVSGRSRGAVVRVGLVDRDVLRLHVGDPARVVLDARAAEAPLAASVTQIATVATPGTGTFDVEVKLDAAPEGLLSGLTAKVEIAHDEAVEGVVPLGAIVDGRGADAALFVIDADRARRVPVKIAFLAGERAAVAAGLGERSAVVAAGAAQLTDGARVRILP